MKRVEEARGFGGLKCGDKWLVIFNNRFAISDVNKLNNYTLCVYRRYGKEVDGYESYCVMVK